MADAALDKIFKEFAKFGNPKSDGKQITLSNVDKWLKEAGIVDGKKVTTTDTGILFKKFKANAIDFKQFKQFVESLAKEKGIDINDVLGKLAKCAVPGIGGATTAHKSKIVEKLTDAAQYTGTHKERFDKDGKGKGKSGREDEAENSGYVQGYKNKDTYEEKKK